MHVARADGVRYPPNTEEKKKNLGNFFGTFPPPKIAGYVPDYVKALKEKNPSVSKYGIIGVSLIPSHIERHSPITCAPTHTA